MERKVRDVTTDTEDLEEIVGARGEWNALECASAATL